MSFPSKNGGWPNTFDGSAPPYDVGSVADQQLRQMLAKAEEYTYVAERERGVNLVSSVTAGEQIVHQTATMAAALLADPSHVLTALETLRTRLDRCRSRFPSRPSHAASTTPSRARGRSHAATSSDAHASKLEQQADKQVQVGMRLHREYAFREASAHYERAILLYIDAGKASETAAGKRRLGDKAEQVMGYYSKLKGNMDSGVKQSDSREPQGSAANIASSQSSSTTILDIPDRQQVSESPTMHRLEEGLSATHIGTQGKAVPGGFSHEELEVIRTTSVINGREYLPWIQQDKLEPLTHLAKPFQDPAGLLAFASKQISAGAVWKRPSEFFTERPLMVKHLSSSVVKQTLISDCSFVSALAISADFEARFKKRLITRRIYPQDNHGNPIYNPSGKYMLQLHFNGCWRKVIVDDRLPVEQGSRLLLCSFSASNELWVSILEKAYLKVMANSYEFPGSNSSVDLHALSGWIPDRNCTDEKWSNLKASLHQGKVLLTVATGELAEAEAERAGLVTGHAYALLDMQDVEGEKLMKLKNPWSRRRWLGNYCPTDTRNWTPNKLRLVRYDRVAAQENDDGVFWIDWKSVKHFFEVIYMNWDSETFPHRYTMHAKWDQGNGPVKDLFTLESNPQYSVEVHATEPAELWMLLTRHITRLSDFAHNEEFITLHVYQGGNRVLYPDDPFILGTKINSPHYLVKLQVPKGKSKFTFVVSQYKKSTTIYFTIKAFCTAKFMMKELKNPFPVETKVASEWTESTAGGCPNYETFQNNPRFELQIPNGDAVPVLLKLQGPKEYSVGMIVKAENDEKFEVPQYRSGIAYLKLTCKSGKRYEVIPSTFKPGQTSKFFLTVASTSRVGIKRIGNSIH